MIIIETDHRLVDLHFLSVNEFRVLQSSLPIKMKAVVA